MENFLYSGTVLGYLGNGYVSVWIPMKGPIPDGLSKFLYANTGSVLDGANLSMCENVAFKCSIATPVKKNGWWRAMPDKAASYFGDGYREGDGIPFYPSLIDSKGRDSYVARRHPPLPSRMEMPQSLPAANYHTVFTLQEIGGDPIPNILNPPKGDYTLPGPGDRVLVAWRDRNLNPVIIGMLPYEEQYKETIDRQYN